MYIVPLRCPCPGIEVRAFVCINCGSVIVIFSSNKPEGVDGQVGDVSFSNNLCGSDLYIVYCLISNAVQLVLLAFALYNGAFLVPDVCLMTGICPCLLLSEEREPGDQSAVCPALCGLISPKKKRGVSCAPVSECIISESRTIVMRNIVPCSIYSCGRWLRVRLHNNGSNTAAIFFSTLITASCVCLWGH